MDERLRPARGVLWYPLGQDLWVIVSPLGRAQEKCRLLDQSQIALLDFFKADSPVDPKEIPQTAEATVKGWLSTDFPILEKAKDPRPLEDHERLALAVFQEFHSARNLEGSHDLLEYHQQKIQDAFSQFDLIEPTVSHLYRERHPALGNKSYGERFAQVLMGEGALKERMVLLEVGCGTGLFGKAFLDEIKESAPEVYRTCRYTFMDLSPVLMNSQQQINKEHGVIVSFIQGNAGGAHGLGKAAYDLVIANEMMADLEVIKLRRDRRRRKGPEGKAWDLAGRLSLDLSDGPPHFILNLGALRFLLHLSEALKPGGKAYVVEYGSPHGYPTGHFITDHMEYSIHFGHLLAAARALGLEGGLHPLTAFLQFDPELEVLDPLSHAALFNHLLPFLGFTADNRRIYTRPFLAITLPELVSRVENLSFVPLRSLQGIGYPVGFQALRLSKGDI